MNCPVIGMARHPAFIECQHSLDPFLTNGSFDELAQEGLVPVLPLPILQAGVVHHSHRLRLHMEQRDCRQQLGCSE